MVFLYHAFNGNVVIDGSIHITAGVYSSCGINAVSCPGLTNKVLSNLVSGQTYPLRLSTSTNTRGSYLVTMQAFPLAVNDNCAGAQTIAGDLTTAQVVPTDYRGATTGTNTSCEGSTPHFDLW